MDEFGEFHSVYVFPLEHEEGDPFPEDFYERLREALKTVGIGYERT